MVDRSPRANSSANLFLLAGMEHLTSLYEPCSAARLSRALSLSQNVVFVFHHLLVVEITIPADPLYQHLLLTAEKKFWRRVESGEPPALFGVEPPRPRIEAVRITIVNCLWRQLRMGCRISCRLRIPHLDVDEMIDRPFLP